ncbi:MAG TPA: rhodanese-like domain-containing protein [Piscirickettsiaceae bacterium]|nr:rhodanese-like domain-containing protein [Piscirickettsiaceae bacterium]HIQ41077.1 rhodanese-like domain-containing protein [Sulfurivirga caldicuralii]
MTRWKISFPVAIFAASVLPLSAQAGKGPSPEQVPGAVTVSTEHAKRLFVQGVKFVDIRSYSDWDAGRIPLAYHIELKKEFTPERLASVVDKHEPVVFYCNSLACHRSAKASKKAVLWGYKKVYYYREGYPAWKKAMNPIE